MKGNVVLSSILNKKSVSIWRKLSICDKEKGGNI